MRVAVVTQFPVDPATPSGGVEAVSVNLVRALAGFSDLEIHVVTQNRELSQPRQESWAGATVHRLPRLPGSELTNAIGRGREQISNCLNQLDPDLVHAHDTYGMMVRGIGLPRVFTIHGFIHGDTLVSGRKFARVRSAIWKHFETGSWRDQPHVISISPYVRERLTGIATGKIHDIDNPISPEFFAIARQEVAGTVFSAAAVCPRKNQLELVRAVALLVERGIEVRLRLAGPVTDSQYGSRVEDLIRASGLQSHVTMLGQIGTARIMDELGTASVFALVSLEENSPMGIEEAMAARVPVITSNRCGMPYMVRNGESGFLVDPHDARDIAGRLEVLLRDEKLRRSFADCGRQIAEERFHPQKVAGRTRMVYVEAHAAA